MKKRMTSVLALMMAMTMVFGSALTVHAEEDGCDHDAGGVSAGGSFDISFDSGSSDSGSYDAGSSSTSSSAPSAATSASVKRAAGSNTGVTGKEQFRALAKSGAGTYKVTHCGKEIATFHLMDADKNAVSCTAVALKQRTDDKKWAINYEVADATGLTVGAPVDRTYMYKTLGVSYVTINDTVVIDIEAEAAAADEAAKTAATAKAAK